MRSVVSRALGTLVAALTLTTLAAAPASATPDPCPGGGEPCVYLAGGSYALGNPVTETVGEDRSTRTVLTHCDSNGTNCSDVVLNLPGLTLQSAETAILTLNVPGQGVGLSGITPTLYVGLPSASLGTLSAGLSLNIRGTAFVVYDTTFDELFSCNSQPLPRNPYVNGYASCSYNLTVTV